MMLKKSRGSKGKEKGEKKKGKNKPPKASKKEKRKSAPPQPPLENNTIQERKPSVGGALDKRTPQSKSWTETAGSQSAQDTQIQVRPERSQTTNIEPKIGIYDWVDLPQFDLRKLATTGRFVQLSGPEPDCGDESFECWEPYVSGRSLSNYPVKKIVNNRPVHMGDPIADYFLARIYVNRTIFALADGCGWGTPARDASRIAVTAFLSYLDARHSDMISVRDSGRLILRGFSEGHKRILKSSDDIWEAGTTTMLAGMILELAPEEDKGPVENGDCKERKESAEQANENGTPDGKEEVVDEVMGKAQGNGQEEACETKGKEKEMEQEGHVIVDESVRWVFVCASVGDCKALHYSKKRREITDITYGNRLDVRSASDPGGRLGAMVGDGAPDLRNLFTHFCPCDEGDLMILLTDGVHDNFDPVTRGLSPSEIGLPDGAWDTITDSVLVEKKSAYLKQEAEKIVHSLPTSPVTGVPSAQSVAYGKPSSFVKY